MSLRFYLAARKTKRFVVSFLTSNMLVKGHSDFLALGFLTVVWVIFKLGMSSVTSTVVDAIEASRISFRFYW